jgi:DNA-binding ferritin-like protein (Dps family)
MLKKSFKTDYDSINKVMMSNFYVDIFLFEIIFDILLGLFNKEVSKQAGKYLNFQKIAQY